MSVAWLFPGQGSQRIGMGSTYPDSPLWHQASTILGYDVLEQCQTGGAPGLSDTRFVQPALFTVNAIEWEQALRQDGPPDFLAGHSLGEFNALLAAGCFDFVTGLELVRRRGELMSKANGGSMIAVVGAKAETVFDCLESAGSTGATIANHNAATQVVLSGSKSEINDATIALQQNKIGTVVPLQVSAAFHSRHMAEAAAQFALVAKSVNMVDPAIPVVSNVSGRPYRTGEVRQLLTQQLQNRVNWWQSMSFLIKQGVDQISEVGPGNVLTGLWKKALEQPDHTVGAKRPAVPIPKTAPDPTSVPTISAANAASRGFESDLGSASFRSDYGLSHAYLSGSMFQGIASTDMAIAMGKAGLFGFYGTGGLPIETVRQGIADMELALGRSGKFGVNLLASPGFPQHETALVDLLVGQDVRFAEASGYARPTAQCVRFRFSGASKKGPRHLIAKVSRTEVAAAFTSPAPEAMIRELRELGQLSAADAALAATMPVAEDLCVEADSGGHTDAGNLCVLLPAMIRMCERQRKQHSYSTTIRVGAAGGLGSSEAIAAAFLMGADFVLTGSINQCTPQADTSEAVKDILSTMDIHDTAYAPAGDMFEQGARVQVVRKGTLFASRGNRLYQLYRQYESLEAIDTSSRTIIEERYFRRSFTDVWAEVEQKLQQRGGTAAERSMRDPKYRMALVFGWYFKWTNQLSRQGNLANRANFQIHSGPAMGAVNHALAESDLFNWQHRDVDALAQFLMQGAVKIIDKNMKGKRP